MTALVLLALLTLLAVLAGRYGADTHRSGEWGTLHDGWPRPDRAHHHRRAL